MMPVWTCVTFSLLLSQLSRLSSSVRFGICREHEFRFLYHPDTKSAWPAGRVLRVLRRLLDHIMSINIDYIVGNV